MNCPTCPTTSLVMTDRAGIEIDYCPDCRGVWLDRGELDKIIDRTNAAPIPIHPTTARPHDPQSFDDRPARRDRDDDDDDRKYQFGQAENGRSTAKRRKKGLLGDLFDF